MASNYMKIAHFKAPNAVYTRRYSNTGMIIVEQGKSAPGVISITLKHYFTDMIVITLAPHVTLEQAKDMVGYFFTRGSAIALSDTVSVDYAHYSSVTTVKYMRGWLQHIPCEASICYAADGVYLADSSVDNPFKGSFITARGAVVFKAVGPVFSNRGARACVNNGAVTWSGDFSARAHGITPARNIDGYSSVGSVALNASISPMPAFVHRFYIDIKPLKESLVTLGTVASDAYAKAVVMVSEDAGTLLKLPLRPKGTKHSADVLGEHLPYLAYIAAQTKVNNMRSLISFIDAVQRRTSKFIEAAP